MQKVYPTGELRTAKVQTLIWSGRPVSNIPISEITEAQFKDIERRQLDAVEWGKECFGIIRVPLFRSCAIQFLAEKSL